MSDHRGRRYLLLFPDALASLGLVRRQPARETFELAVPAMVSAGIWTILRITDFFMVSLALSDTAVAALEFSFQYYIVGFNVAIAVSSGTISLVSRFKGAGEDDLADFVIKQSLWFAIPLSALLTALAWFYAEGLVGLLTNEPEVIRLGSIYLSIVMLGVGFRFWTMIASRGLQGCGDTVTPMYISIAITLLNIVLNAFLIFGIGPAPELGIAGAALGTVIANGLGAVVYLVMFRSDRFPLRLRLGGKQWDTDIAVEILRVGTPLAGRRLVATIGRFPFLFMLGVLGTPVVAAFAIARQVSMLAMIPGWGYSTSASALVGQRLGQGDEEAATEYAWDTMTVGLATQLVIAALFAVFARRVALLFGTEAVELTTTFIWIFALGIAGFSVAQSIEGSLRGAGDTTWPLYGTIIGTSSRLVITALALPVGFVLVTVVSVPVTPGLGLGVSAIFVAILVEPYVRAVVNLVRFKSGRWQAVARAAVARQEEAND
ncbi:MAG: MATE family efflux transporter [Natronomonas sp.]